MKILDDVIATLAEDAAVQEVRVGPFWTAVVSRECGLASTVVPVEHEHGAIFVQEAGSLAGRSALAVAKLAYSESTLEAGIGVAAINSLLEVDEARCVDLNARDLLVERGRGKKVALVGHFPFVPALREAAGQLWVIELHPQAGDVGAEEVEAILPEVDIAAITGSAFLNHTIERLLGLCRPETFVVVLGPSTPLSAVLFDYGVDVVSGTRVVDAVLALRCISEGATFRQIEGVRLLTMERK
ncbi:MAG: Rossmann-like domain-containing protein [Dehalococcoidia bacterium]